MQHHHRLYIVSSLILLIATLVFGMLASWAFLYPLTYNSIFPFYQARPFHVSAALFWIITGATACILFFKKEVLPSPSGALAGKVFVYTWLASILAVFVCYSFRLFGGREYWEFPPVLCLPILVSWVFLAVSWFAPFAKVRGRKPLYMWMWSTGIFFFLLTFVEQNLWQIPWFRLSYLREITVQWKSNGAMVGAWNQMIYGTSLYLMVKISGDEQMARSRSAYFFYMLGLTNLMFNWGHHLYNVPAAAWIRDGAYLISMTEWIFLIRMIHGFRTTLRESKRLQHLISYRFIIAAEFWVFMNLLLTLAMSIPAINRYTHGTHITVAHAMGATIGINSMILLGAFSWILEADMLKIRIRKAIAVSYWGAQISLAAFWLSLIAAGIVKAYRTTALNITSFQEVMAPVTSILKVFNLLGVGLLISLGTIAFIYLRRALRFTPAPVATIPAQHASPKTRIVRAKENELAQ